MNNKQDYYKTLLERYLNEGINWQEAEKLFAYLAEHSEDISALLGQDDRARFDEKIRSYSFSQDGASERMRNRLLSEISSHKRDNTEAQPNLPTVRHLKKRWAWFAAASVLLSGGVYYSMTKTAEAPPMVAETPLLPADVAPPQSTQAFITLSGGQKIVLNEIDGEKMAETDKTKIIKGGNGEISYETGEAEATGYAYNTLWNPRGSKVVQMKFSDGSLVWLNAGTSVTYPVRFSGKERRVSVSGEAYFEVTHNKEMPFVVNNGSTDITVLGTRFNVNAYSNDETKITLLEGSVKINIPGAGRLLRPGQQAKINEGLQVINNANIDEVMAWKNGLFKFDNADIYAIMKKVARWYDIRVIYDGDITTERFQGTISMDTKLSELLEVLELNKIAYSIENRTVKIKAK